MKRTYKQKEMKKVIEIYAKRERKDLEAKFEGKEKEKWNDVAIELTLAFLVTDFADDVKKQLKNLRNNLNNAYRKWLIASDGIAYHPANDGCTEWYGTNKDKTIKISLLGLITNYLLLENEWLNAFENDCLSDYIFRK